MNFKSAKGDINLPLLITTFLVCIIIAAGVAFFHSQYYPTKFLEYKASEISDKFLDSGDFVLTAKNLLNSRNDISYLKLLSFNGVLEESFGNDKVPGTKKFAINGPDNKSIIIGLKTTKSPLIDTYALIWSLLIGFGMAIVLISIILMRNSSPTRLMKKLESAMDRISQGDFTARLDVDSLLDEDIHIINIYQSFNRMAYRLNKKYKTEEIISEQMDKIEADPKRNIFKLNEEEIDKKNLDGVNKVGTIDDTADEITKDKDEKFDLNTEINDISDEDIKEIKGTDNKETEKRSLFRPKIVLSGDNLYPKFRNVSVFVAKIGNFENLSKKLDASELDSFLTEYRKSASQIITNYGGTVEALVQDEIVAIFNAPDEQNDPELKSVCAAVEVLHELAGMAKKRMSEDKEIATGKIGISTKVLSYYSKSGIPGSVKNVIKDARSICNNANTWKVYVSSELYNEVKDFVDVKKYILGGKVLYSITGVEQEVVQRENFS